MFRWPKSDRIFFSFKKKLPIKGPEKIFFPKLESIYNFFFFGLIFSHVFSFVVVVVVVHVQECNGMGWPKIH